MTEVRTWKIVAGFIAVVLCNTALAACQLATLEDRIKRIEQDQNEHYQNRILLTRDTVIQDGDTVIREVTIRKP